MQTIPMTVLAAAMLSLTACTQPEPPEILAAKTALPFLLEPDRAVFRLPPVQKPIIDDGEFYCGMLNAPNGFGGMTGMLTFAAFLENTDDGIVAAFYDIDGPQRISDASITLPELCETAGYPQQLLFEAKEWRPPAPSRD